MDRYLVINGPNLNLLGEREPEIYGTLTLEELTKQVDAFAGDMDCDLRFLQSNHEGNIIDFLHDQREWAEGVVINPGALTHYSYALRDAISAISLPAVEVHLTNILEREAFRQISVVEAVCRKRYLGMGIRGYLRAVEYLKGLKTVALVNGCAEQNIVEESVRLLKSRHPKYTWVGIYLVEGNELQLSSFLGRPTPHERIAIGEGICGAAAQNAESIIVADVDADPRYLACSVETRSEIVVPIFSGDEVVGEIDIDSDQPDAFHEDDQAMLEACAKTLGLAVASIRRSA